jgi:hypothetical protein
MLKNTYYNFIRYISIDIKLSDYTLLDTNNVQPLYQMAFTKKKGN